MADGMEIITEIDGGKEEVRQIKLIIFAWDSREFCKVHWTVNITGIIYQDSVDYLA